MRFETAPGEQMQVEWAVIRRGADLPLWLIFVGVIGGLLGFGLIGIFVGPVVLAVTYTLTQSWVDETPPQEVKD